MDIMSAEHLKQEKWIGRQQSTVDVINARPMRLMQAMLDRTSYTKTGDALPPLWHWIYFPAENLQNSIAEDGHTIRGGFLPPIDLPRRMWAGGRFKFKQPLRIGDTVTKISTIKDIKYTQGRSGKLCFVTVEHKFSVENVTCFSEEHDIVYRNYPTAEAPLPKLESAPSSFDWQRQIKPDPVLLFRYSALTFNGHRIHYDRGYCRDVEGYPGLVFHGPLTATLLLDLLLENVPGKWISKFDFRATLPLYDAHSFTIAGQQNHKELKLWAADNGGNIAMQAEAVLS